MVVISPLDAQQQLPELLAAAEAGETVVIRTATGGSIRLASQPDAHVNPDWPGFPHPGSAKGLIEVPDDFDAPLDELREYAE